MLAAHPHGVFLDDPEDFSLPNTGTVCLQGRGCTGPPQQMRSAGERGGGWSASRRLPQISAHAPIMPPRAPGNFRKPACASRPRARRRTAGDRTAGDRGAQRPHVSAYVSCVRSLPNARRACLRRKLRFVEIYCYTEISFGRNLLLHRNFVRSKFTATEISFRRNLLPKFRSVEIYCYTSLEHGMQTSQSLRTLFVPASPGSRAGLLRI